MNTRLIYKGENSTSELFILIFFRRKTQETTMQLVFFVVFATGVCLQSTLVQGL